MNISSLALTATPQAVTAVTVCHTITVKEDESVANWPTVSIWISATASSTPNKLTAGKSFTFEAPPRRMFAPGDVVGYIATATGTTTGLQVEQ
jgi:hypothetical protein